MTWTLSKRPEKSRIRESQLQFLRQSTRLEESTAPYLMRSAMNLLSIMVFAFIAWMAFANIEEITQANGEVVPNGFTQIVQHYDGGIVKEIMVREGSHVQEGDALIKLDGVGAQEELNRANLVIKGLEETVAMAREVFDIQENLKEQGVSSHVRYLEAKQALSQAENDLAQQKEMQLRWLARVERLEVRAPATGYVKGLKLNTIGEVVKPAEPLMEIVPSDEVLVVEARIAPSDVGRVQVGQPVKVKVSSFDYGRYGAVNGTLEFVSASTFESLNHEKYYQGRIMLERNYVGMRKNLKIMPGMTVQAGIITGKKTILAYLLKPIQRAFEGGMSEK